MGMPKLALLKKETLQETYKQLNILLAKEKLDGDILSTLPDSALLNTYEKSVKLIIINTLKLEEGVLSALLSGDKLQIKRALKCGWFFEKADVNLYTTKIFPEVSLSTRYKIVNKLSKHVTCVRTAEELVTELRLTYGSKLSEMLLYKCSSPFILQYIENKDPLFNHNTSYRVLVNICKRHPCLVTKILQHVFKEERIEQRSKLMYLLMYLARDNKQALMNFCQEHRVLQFVKCGAKLSKWLVKNHKTLVLSQELPLNHHVVMKNLTESEKIQYLANQVHCGKGKPETSTWELKSDDLLKGLKGLKAEEKATLLNEVFKKLFGSSFWSKSNVEMWTPNLCEALPLVNRLDCYRILVAECESNPTKEWRWEWGVRRGCRKGREVEGMRERLFHWLEGREVFEGIKGKLKKCPYFEERGNWLVRMIKSCSLNHDLVTLEEVLKYIVVRHRNEDVSVLSSVLSKIYEEFNSEHFTQNHWTAIRELIQIVLVQGECSTEHQEWMDRYVWFKIQNDESCRELVMEMVKYWIAERMDWHPFLAYFKKEVFFVYYEEIVRLLKTEAVPETKRHEVVMGMLRSLNEFNAQTRGAIDLNEVEYLVNEVQAVLDSEDLKSENHLELLMENDALLKRFWERLSWDSLQENSLRILVKVGAARKVAEFFDFLLGSFSSRHVGFMKQRKVFEFHGIVDEVKKRCVEKFESGVLKERVNALTILSYLANASEFKEVVREFLPKGDVIDYDDGDKEEIQIGLLIPVLVKNLYPVQENWDLVWDLAKRDHLKPLIGGLLSTFDNSPAPIVVEILTSKLDTIKRVSVRKHLLRGLSRICPIPEVLRRFSDLWPSETHYTLRTVLFDVLGKCFVESPSQDSFNVFKNCLLESEDLVILARPDIRIVPATYREGYARSLLQLCDRLESEGSREVIGIRNDLFHPANISFFSEDLCEENLKRFLFAKSSSIKIEEFACAYLVYDSTKQRLNFVLSLAETRRENDTTIISFLRTLCQFLLDKDGFGDILCVVLDRWNKLFPTSAWFVEFWSLKFYSLYCVLSENESALRKKMREAILELEERTELCYVVSRALSRFLDTLNRADRGLDEVELMLELLGEGKDRGLAVIAVFALTDRVQKDFRYEKVVNRMQKVQDSVVQVYWHLRLNTYIEL